MKKFSQYVNESLDTIDSEQSNIYSIQTQSKGASEADFVLDDGVQLLKLFMKDPISIESEKLTPASIKKLLSDDGVKSVYVNGFNIEDENMPNTKLTVDDFIYRLEKHMENK